MSVIRLATSQEYKPIRGCGTCRFFHAEWTASHGMMPMKTVGSKEGKMERAEHLAWCKKRALEYLNQGDIPNAITSMMSDMQKHPETKFDSPALTMFGMLAIRNNDEREARRYIEGFN